jgi:hypothetical protein
MLQFLISVALKCVLKTNMIDIRQQSQYDFLYILLDLMIKSVFLGFFSIASTFPLLSTSLGYALIINWRLIWQIFYI